MSPYPRAAERWLDSRRICARGVVGDTLALDSAYDRSAMRARTARWRARLHRWVVLGAAGLAMIAGSVSAASAAGPSRVESVHLAVRPMAAGAAVSEITVATGGPVRYSARLEDSGKRLLINLADCELAAQVPSTADPAGVVTGLLTQAFRSATGSTVRLAVSLASRATYRIRPEPRGLVISLAEESSSSERVEPRANLEARTPATVSETVRLRDIRFERGAQRDVLRIELTGATAYSVSTPASTRSQVELSAAELPRELERILDVSASSTRVRAISAFRRGSKVVLEAERSPEVLAEIVTQGPSLLWIFHRASEPAMVDSGVAPDGGAARRVRTVGREADVGDVPRVETSISDSLARERAAQAEPTFEAGSRASRAAAFLPGMAAQPRDLGGTHYTGRRIDLDLKDADIHNVLRLLSDVGHVNVITADTVAGNITIRMRNVPWDQALDVVLQAKGLGMVRQGNLVRVAPLAELEKERELLIARRRQELELAPIETRLVPVSYARAEEIQPRARELLSPRGSIAVDERTNLLIVRDVAGNLNQVEELVRSLDTQTPEVLVEARIVEATSRYSRDIGIQWGGDATFSPSTGNPTGVAFPSAVGVAGGASDGSTPTAGLSPFDRTVANPNFAVNLPAAVGTGSGGAIGLTLGSINNTVNLGVRLSAAEASGMVRIVSSPRILTMDNRDARITQGTLIPFSQVSAQGVQTTFQEAKLQLFVRPHVTAEGSVAMHVKVNRDEPDFTQTSARGDPTILKREAETDLLVMDGHTAVIGGIYTRNSGRNVDQVPFFGDIPILGLLFQRRRASDNRGELVIFLTPRIVNRSEALGK